MKIIQNFKEKGAATLISGLTKQPHALHFGCSLNRGMTVFFMPFESCFEH